MTICIKWLADWLIGCLTDWLIDRLTDLLSEWVSDWLTERPTDRPVEWPIDWPTDWQTEKPAEWMSDRLTTDWQTQILTDWKAERLTVGQAHVPKCYTYDVTKRPFFCHTGSILSRTGHRRKAHVHDVLLERNQQCPYQSSDWLRVRQEGYASQVDHANGSVYCRSHHSTEHPFVLLQAAVGVLHCLWGRWRCYNILNEHLSYDNAVSETTVSRIRVFPFLCSDCFSCWSPFWRYVAFQ